MTSSLSGFTTVLIGDNFPVGSMSAADFLFRGRRFTEKMRLGPLLQASTREVELQALPERFDIGITAPDDLDIQAEGVNEVVAIFLEFVGRRTITAVGHNAHVRVSNTTLRSLLGGLVRADVAKEVLGAPESPTRNVVFRVQQDNGSQMTVNIGADETLGSTGGGLVNFNFNFNLAELTERNLVGFATGELRACLAQAEQLASAVVARFTQEVVR